MTRFLVALILMAALVLATATDTLAAKPKKGHVPGGGGWTVHTIQDGALD